MRMLFPLLIGVASPAMAQDHSDYAGHAGHMDHANHATPATVPAEPENAHSGHDMHAGHTMPTEAPAQIGNTPAPLPPTDHAADQIHDPVAMAKAREALLLESGGMQFNMVMIDRAEIQFRDGEEGYAWEGEAWFGGDINRLKLKFSGEGDIDGAIEEAELQALYSRALDPWWNVVAGMRHDIRPDPSRTYAVIGVEGLAPYWFHLEGLAFLSEKGDVHLRAEASVDQRITQRLILQPAAEVNFALQDVPALHVGAGLTDFELGTRLRYEIKPEFAPYIGVEWHRKTGETARLARLGGEDVSAINIVAGIRFWF